MSNINEKAKFNCKSLLEVFSVVEDSRNGRKRYPLLNILIFTFVSTLSDQNSWYQIADFCTENLSWFSSFLDVSTGIPSHDTFRRVMSIIDPKQMEMAVVHWVEATRKASGSNRRVVVLDGKSLRGVAWKVDERQLHILNAWDATEEQFVGQVTVESKTNEITAAPELLGMMSLENTVISVDALMTQKEIARVIVDGKGDYVMALKGNQGTLFEDVKVYFDDIHDGMSCARTVDKNRGQVEIRTSTKTSDISWLNQKEDWEGLQTLLRVTSEIVKNGQTTVESRYFISSLDDSAKELLDIVRKHWGIENKLHRTLDVHFKEDACQVHNRNAAANLSVLRKIAISLLKQIDPRKTLISKMKKAAYSPEFRKRVLLGEF